MPAHRLPLLLAYSAVVGLSHVLTAAPAPTPTISPAPPAAASANIHLSQFEENLWPYIVRQSDPIERRVDAWTGAGPFLFNKPAADFLNRTAHGFRPLWVQFDTPEGEFRAGHFLYPIFSYTVDENTYKWSIFELIRLTGRRPSAAPPTSTFDARGGEFEIFPIWFSRQTGNPEFSYRGLFPIYGTVKNKLFLEKFSWTLFPLYGRNEKRGGVTTFAPWPFIRVRSGATKGWGLWPLYDHLERPGVLDSTYYLWPLGYNITRQPHPDDPAGTAPRRDIGALPFYASSTGPGYVNKDFLWPFFGYTERTAPLRYSERRYFWPFVVQGRGDQRYVSRYAPFYTHSISKGVDKQWYMWPLVRRAAWVDEGIARERTQFLYFLYWSEEQRAAGRTNSPTAELTHVWPLVSSWDNGAGRRQWQFPSPLEVFFTGNAKVRQTWSPFFTLAKHDQRAPGDARTSFLWDAITWEKRASEDRSELHVGPLFNMTRQAETKRIAIGNGLFGFTREPGRGWRPFWLDFPSKKDKSSPAAPPVPANATR
ncbi:MAG: hypothetical protein V4773_31085 [Verrucomicrobiota bacterium]